MKLLTHPEVLEALGMTKAAFVAFRKNNDDFPKPIRITERVLRWEEGDIDLWLTTKKESNHGEDSRLE